MAGGAVVVLLAAAIGVAVGTGGEEDPAAPPAAQAPVPAVTWLSGAAGEGVATGEFGEWRGRPVDIAATWVDDNEAMVYLWQLQPGGEFGSWNRPLDISVGAISEEESWAEAADGAYDDRWRESLTNLRDLWSSRSAPLYIRFAHEMNGNWFPWQVTVEDRDDFVAAWIRYRELQREIFPEAQLVFSVNRESLGNSMDWREAFPGPEYVDLLSVDYYNQYPYVQTQEEWDASVDATDKYGAPKGLAQHLEFARSVGLPLAVSEWSGHADNGDSPVFVENMFEFFAEHAGTGAGQLLYEIQFNVDIDDSRWLLYGGTRMPDSAETYRSLW